MHASVDVHLDITIEDGKTLTLGTLASAITDQDIEAEIVDAVVQEVDSRAVQEYCGEKYARGNGEKRFQRAGTTTRSATTSAGEHEFTLHNVKDTEEDSYFRPVEDVITFDGKRHYQEDVAMKGVDLATKLSYRDAADEGDLFTSLPSASTINRRVKEYGAKLQTFITENLSTQSADCVQADGTKCHSQEASLRQHDIRVSLDAGEDDLLDVRVNDDWEEMAGDLEDADAIAGDATLVSDADPELRSAFLTEERSQQLDLVHLVRTTGYKLWQDGELELEARKDILRSVEDVIYPLTWAVERYRRTENRSQLEERIEETVSTLRQMATNLSSLGCPQAAGYLRRCSRRAATFARLAMEGDEVPWTSNRIERLMGEIAKRCKHQWMSWTTPGLEALLRLLLIRSTNPPVFEAFKQRITNKSDQNYISAEVSIQAARGRSRPN